MRKYLNSRADIAFWLIFFFSFNSLGPIPSVQAEGFNLPKPGVMLALSPLFNPPILKGLKVNPNNPLRFEFILDQGDTTQLNAKAPQRNYPNDDQELRIESTKLIKYFLASLTIPEKDLWVNLSPYEKDRIVPTSFGQTEMGRDLLAEDYMLKQITASLIYPEGEIGKKFWARIYAEAAKRFGTTNIPVNTFNKVWIVPDKAVVYENVKANTVYVVESKLKVMLDQDYLAMEKNLNNTSSPNVLVGDLGNEIIREIIIPELNKEVNEGKNFIQLRQVYNSLILAAWYKKKIKYSILAQVYEDKNKIQGLLPTRGHIPLSRDVSSGTRPSELVLNAKAPQGNHTDVELIYQQYLEAFKKGAYNYIKEEQDPLTQQMLPRKYFSGGANLIRVDAAMSTTTDQGDLPVLEVNDLVIKADVSPVKSSGAVIASRMSDSAQLARKLEVPEMMTEPAHRWDWDRVVFDQMDGHFKDWVESGGMNPFDLELLKKILSGNQFDLKELLRSYGSKVFIKFQDKTNPGINGRTVYLRLTVPFPSPNGDITILRIKGARPAFQFFFTGIKSHFGGGFSTIKIIVDEMGKAIIKQKAFFPQIFEWSPEHIDPQGAMLKESAELEYHLMQKGIAGLGFETDYPIAVGWWKNKAHMKRPVGFVIAGMRTDDIRIGRAIVKNADSATFDIIKYIRLKKNLKVTREIYRQIGKSMRAYHDAGYFHRFPHPSNWGIEYGKNGEIRVIMRDLDTTHMRDSLGDKNLFNREATYRFFDIDNIFFHLIYDAYEGDIFEGKDARDAEIARQLIESFLQGYFDGIPVGSNEFERLLGDIISERYREMMKKWNSMDNIILNEHTPVLGNLWEHLYTLSRDRAMKTKDSLLESKRKIEEILTEFEKRHPIKKEDMVLSPQEWLVENTFDPDLLNRFVDAMDASPNPFYDHRSSNYYYNILLLAVEEKRKLIWAGWMYKSHDEDDEKKRVSIEKNKKAAILVGNLDSSLLKEIPLKNGVALVFDQSKDNNLFFTFKIKRSKIGELHLSWDNSSHSWGLTNINLFHTRGEGLAALAIQELVKFLGVIRSSDIIATSTSPLSQKMWERITDSRVEYIGFNSKNRDFQTGYSFVIRKDAGMGVNLLNKGGIDLSVANMDLQTQNSGQAVKFHIDPAQLAQLRDAPGFVPVIIDIKPLKDLKGFLSSPL